jgi:hypothetical protein
MKTIEALSPGLYEMTIDEQIGEGVDAHFIVSFHERKLADIRAIDNNDRSDERDFAAVQRFSELNSELYEIGVRPLVQAMITPQVADLLRKMHPARVSRAMFGDANPLMKGIGDQAERVRAVRQPADKNNPFLYLERLLAQSVENTFDVFRDWRDAIYEATFFSVWGSPAMLRLGHPFAFERTLKDPKKLRYLPEVQQILLNVDRGGFEEAVIRMLILMAESRGTVRRDRLERSAKVLGHDEPFASLGPERRAALIHEQSVIVEFESDLAVKTLPDLLPDMEERRRALDVVEFIAGAVEEMEPKTIQMVQRFRAALGLPGLALPAPTQDPLKESATAAKDDLSDVMTQVATTVEAAKADNALEAVKGGARGRNDEAVPPGAADEARRRARASPHRLAPRHDRH